MADNFGLKIGVEGEKEFKKALSDINQSFKVLGSEMKLVESEFGKNENSVQSLTAKNEVLTKQIDAQKEKIETLRKALENAALGLEAHLQSDIAPVYDKLFNRLSENGHSAEQIAIAVLSLVYKDLTGPAVAAFPKLSKAASSFSELPENLALSKQERGSKRRTDVKSDSRSKYQDKDFGMVVFSMGKNNKLTPNHLLGAILDRTTLEKNEIGRIDIGQSDSFVEISQERVEEVLAVLGTCKINGKSMSVKPLLAEKTKTSRALNRGKNDYGNKAKRPAKGKYGRNK